MISREDEDIKGDAFTLCEHWITVAMRVHDNVRWRVSP